MCSLQPRVRVEQRRCAPATCPCPRCGVPGRRKQTHTRTVRCLAYREILLLELTTAEDRARCGCCKTFRSQVEGVPPRAEYTNKVREAVLDRLLEDKMSVEGLRKALARDFCLELSDGFGYDCLDAKARRSSGADYRRWAIEQFSGTLCGDEIHLGQKTLLLATDPISDLPVAFALVSANDQEHLRRFLGNLKSWGFWPRVVVTDGSNLYPALLKELWSNAEHQLCVFHVIKDLNEKVLDAVKRPRRQKARQGNGGRKRRRGRPSTAQAARRRCGLTAKDKAHFVFKKRHLIVQRREGMSRPQQQDLATMLSYLPQLRVVRQFADAVLRLLGPDQSVDQAHRRWRWLQGWKPFQAVPELARALAMLRLEQFEKMIAFLSSPVGQRVRTNNQVERMNRQLRYLEKVRYKWRRRRPLVRFLVLALDRWRRQRPGVAQQKPAARPQASPTAEPPTSHPGPQSVT